jgi:ATP-binding cassette subfamily C protein EexD
MQKNIKSELKLILASFRKNFAYVALFSMFINMLMLVPPIYMLQVYDRVMASRSVETLIMLTLIVVWLFITMGVLDFIRSRILVRLGTQMDERLNGRLFDSMNRFALRYPGKGSSQPLSDLTTIRQFMTGSGPFAFFDAPWIPFYFAILFLFHPWLGIFSIFAAIILIIVAIFNDLSTKKLMLEANNNNAKSMALVNAQLRNAEVLHAMGMGDKMRERWLQQHLNFLKAQSDASDGAGLWMNLSKTLRMMFQSLMLGLGGYLAISNEISAGMVIAGSILMGRALAPIDQMIGAWKQFGAARVSHKRLDALLNEFPAEIERMSLPAPKGALQVETLTIVPPGSQQAVLRAVSFAIDAGDSLVILGASAAGKSSLLRAIVGVWPSTAGAVRLDGTEIPHWNRTELGPYIGYLPQDVELFEGTVAENISRFNDLDSEKIVAAAKMAGVDEMIRHLPEGYETLIGAGGATLSGGQRQRVGLARALYGSPSLVILDEPNANLDEVGEKALVNACVQLKKAGTTLILVTHRTNILGIADKILLLADGMVKLFGPRDEVLQKLQAHTQQQQQAQAPQQIPAKPAPAAPAGVVNIPHRG